MTAKFLFSSGHGDGAVSFGLLVLRVALGGMMFIGHGLGKVTSLVTDWSGTVEKFPALVINSQISALGAATCESVFALFVVLGIATRFSAAAVAFTMGVAAFVVHAGAPVFMGPGVQGAMEPALIYMVGFAVLAITGGGRYALDARLR